MSQKCLNDKCQRLSQALCKCCRKEFCLQHLSDHINFNRSQLDLFKIEIGKIDRQLKTFNIEKAKADFRQRLIQWRIDSYTTIDRFSDQKYHEYSRYVHGKFGQHSEDIRQLQKRIHALIGTEDDNEQDLGFINLYINELEEKIRKVEQTLPAITIAALVVDEQLIQIDN